MTHPFELDLEIIKKEAQEAAFFHDDINAACPYPFATMAGAVFKDAFKAAKASMPPAKPAGAALMQEQWGEPQ
jgi:hypothetical protein